VNAKASGPHKLWLIHQASAAPLWSSASISLVLQFSVAIAFEPEIQHNEFYRIESLTGKLWSIMKEKEPKMTHKMWRYQQTIDQNKEM
jgi:hypothetical protein